MAKPHEFCRASNTDHEHTCKVFSRINRSIDTWCYWSRMTFFEEHDWLVSTLLSWRGISKYQPCLPLKFLTCPPKNGFVGVPSLPLGYQCFPLRYVLKLLCVSFWRNHILYPDIVRFILTIFCYITIIWLVYFAFFCSFNPPLYVESKWHFLVKSCLSNGRSTTLVF